MWAKDDFAMMGIISRNCLFGGGVWRSFHACMWRCGGSDGLTALSLCEGPEQGIGYGVKTQEPENVVKLKGPCVFIVLKFPFKLATACVGAWLGKGWKRQPVAGACTEEHKVTQRSISFRQYVCKNLWGPDSSAFCFWVYQVA